MIVRRYNSRTGTFEPMPGGERLFSAFRALPRNASERDFQRKLRSAGLGELRYVEPSFRKTSRRFGPGTSDIFSGYSVNPPPEAVSGYQNTVSWINAVWNVPNIRTPLWLSELMVKYPAQAQAAITGSLSDVLDSITWTAEEQNVFEILARAINSLGFACASWVGIQDVNGTLVQAGVSSFIPNYTNPYYVLGSEYVVSKSTVQPETYVFTSEYIAFFEFDPSQNLALALPLQVSPGDTVHVLVQMLGPKESDVVQVGSSYVGPPQESANTAVVYFGNVSQDWYTAFAVSADAFSNTPGLVGQRTAFWVIEQESKPFLGGVTAYWNDIPRTGLGPLDTAAKAGGTVSDLVIPLARHGTMFFTNAVCGQWLSTPFTEEPIGGLFVDSGAGPPASIAATELYEADPATRTTAFAGALKYALVYPAEALSVQPEPSKENPSLAPGGPWIMTDTLWNYVVMPPPRVVATPTVAPASPPASPPPLTLPPLGPAYQYGLPYNGAALSAGQLVAEDIVMCKYVYPAG